MPKTDFREAAQIPLDHTTDADAFDAFEVNACVDCGSGAVEPLWGADMHLAQFFTVYGHKTGEGATALHDFTTRKLALAYANKRAARTFAPVYSY